MENYLGLKRNLSVVEEYKGLAIVGGYKNGKYKVSCISEDNNKRYVQTGSGIRTYDTIGQAKEQIDFYLSNIERYKSNRSEKLYKTIHY